MAELTEVDFRVCPVAASPSTTALESSATKDDMEITTRAAHPTAVSISSKTILEIQRMPLTLDSTIIMLAFDHSLLEIGSTHAEVSIVIHKTKQLALFSLI